jgi:hypothetical protein
MAPSHFERGKLQSQIVGYGAILLERERSMVVERYGCGYLGTGPVGVVGRN